MRVFFSLFIALFFYSFSSAQLKSPDDFLPSDYTMEFTPHHLLVGYLQHVAANSDRIKLEQIGFTNEDRPQYICFISSPNNLKNLENIRLTNLYNTGVSAVAPPQAIELPLTMLSYSVHGNEAAGSEASMAVIYELVSSKDPKIVTWLENSVIIINPSINPDGYDRYTSWDRGIASQSYNNPEQDHREHHEPWPRGRVSHYLFDLNRDWAWQTQKEIRNFMAFYNKWLPHVHADIHEMGYNSHYYFAPAADPYHKYITKHQRDFQTEIGKNHAHYFDEKGWLYFTREVFDLFYPSYGDTYPTYNGAIGMTYEKGGISAGKAVFMSNGDELTLARRIEQHKTTSLSTIEISASQGKKLVSEFKTFFKDAKENPKGKFKTYVIKNNAKLDRLVRILQGNDIQYNYADEAMTSSGYHYQSESQKSFTIEKGDLIVQAHQPKSVMTQVLLEINHELVDSNTYDITAWSLPLVFNVETYGVTTPLKIKTTRASLREEKTLQQRCVGKKYAYIIPWQNIASAKILSQLYINNFTVRMAKSDVKHQDQHIAKGSLIVTRGDNPMIANFDEEIKPLLDNNCSCIATGLSGMGGDIGGSAFTLLKKTQVLTLTGEGTSNNEVGQIWHYFDEVINHPLTQSNVADLDDVDLGQYSVLILPDGSYSLDDTQVSRIKSWVRSGGRLIVMAAALDIFNDKEGWALATYATDDEKSQAKKDKETRALAARKDHYHDHDRSGLSDFIPGAIVENTIDPSHPLSFALGGKYYSMKTSTQYYHLLKEADNVIYTPSNYRHYGFIGSKIIPLLKESINVSAESMGRGKVVYMVDNPLFRGFIENGNILFGNAVFLNW